MIKKYDEKYLNDIIKLSMKSWAGEFMMDKSLNDFIYSFLPRYYLSSPELSIVDYENGLNGFFLVSYGEESKMGDEFFHERIKGLSNENIVKALKYKEYLDYNHKKVVSYMKDGEIYLALLASAKKGTGTKLWKYIEDIAKAMDIHHLYFWTDETCNYHYYDNKGYTKLEEYYVEAFGRKLKTFIYRCDV